MGKGKPHLLLVVTGSAVALLYASAASARALTYEDRVAAQKAIEQVYWNHRLWPADNPGPKPPLSEVMPDTAIRARVEDYLLNSNALDSVLGRPITAADLQRELDRMAGSSRAPVLLHELFDALGNDPHVIAETLVRETLADNLLRAARPVRDFDAWWRSARGTLRPEVNERGAAYTLPAIGESPDSRPAPQPLAATAPSARSGQSTVWTGSAMLVWGGEPTTNTGGLYDPVTDSWTPTSTGAGVPDPRSRHSAVWTGSEMIVWGGLTGSGETNTGGRYVPATDSWTAITTGLNCPSARQWHTAVWTGTKMIVWGGTAGSTYFNTGGVYDPAGDAWTATGTGVGVASVRARHTAVWTGTVMVVWGGTDSVGRLNTGSRYTPGTDAWSATATTAAPTARYRHSVVWTGSQMIVWGGFGTTYLGTGARYNPALNSWAATAGGPSVRADHSAVWSGTEMIVWGGVGPNAIDTGARYNLSANTWTLVPSGSGSPTARSLQSAVWTGLQMIVWGGLSGATALDTGATYDPVGASWLPTATPGPSIRFQPRPWTGSIGGIAIFTVSGSGNAPLSYQWRKDGAPLSDGPRLSGTSGDTLTITALAAGDAGAYSVVVTNDVSSATSNDASLTVGTPQGGDVDPSFVRGATIDHDRYHGPRAVAALSDGKTLIAGEFTNLHGAPRGHIARLNSDGTTDQSFMNGMAGANDTIYAMLVQPDGQILIGGAFTSVNGVSRNRIARLNPDGSLDATFQNGMGGTDQTVYTIALQPDGRVLISGEFEKINGDMFYLHQHLARLKSDGSTDTTFTGKIDGTCGNCPGASDIALQSDGKMVVVGQFSQVNSDSYLRIARLNADGTTDTTFLNGMSGPDYEVTSVEIQPDGKIVVGGGFYNFNGVARPDLARLNTDGSLDPSFFPGGALGPNNGYVQSVVLQPDGRILIGGSFSQVDGVPTGYVARVLADGTLDTSFQSALSQDEYVETLSLRSDGKVAVAGYFTTAGGVPANHLTRLNADGSRDDTFQTFFGVLDGAVHAVTIQPDGRAIIAGEFTTVDGVPRSGIVRLNADGSLDTTFQDAIGASTWGIDAVVLQPDGRILVGGLFWAVGGVSRRSIARMNPDGSLDTTFQNGMSGVEGDGGRDASVLAIALRPDGKMFIGGDFTVVNGVTQRIVALLNADGSLDTSFASNAFGTIRSLLAYADGRVLVGGSFQSGETVERLNADGSLDSTFAHLYPDLLDFSEFAAQPDGRVLVAGHYWSVPYQQQIEGVSRFNDDGTLDATFSRFYLASNFRKNFETAWQRRVYSMVLQPDGRLLIGGSFPSVDVVPRGGLARINGDGSLDTSFEDTMTGVVGTVEGLALLPDGRILAGGTFGGANGVVSGNVIRLYGSAAVGPAVSTPPSDQSSYAGSCAVFHVAATGTPLNYQWRKGGVPLADGTSVSGAHGADLTLTGLTAADAGSYDVVVSNVLGSVSSAAATLTVANVPACKVATCDPVLGSVLSDAADGTACDDGNACTAGDACAGGACVPGAPVPPPSEVGGVAISGHATSTLSWTDLGDGASYDVATSTLSDLRATGTAGATCLANDVALASYDDTRPAPNAGDGYYYLVRGQTACGSGGYGTDSSGLPRAPATGCP